VLKIKIVRKCAKSGKLSVIGHRKFGMGSEKEV